MAQKTLTAKVNFDTKSAEASLSRLEKKIKLINKVVNTKTGKSSIEKEVERAVIQQEKLRQATLKTQLAEERLCTQKQKTALAAQRVTDATNKSATSANKLSTAFNNGNSSANALLSTVKKIASAYLGIGTMKLAIDTSDKITSAQNLLGNIEGGSPELTQEILDKTYAASQRSRTGYTDMLNNVGKSMVLAGDAFQDNPDNAIRFQEIMSKAYSVGGASAAEQSTSMYQLVQALGSGVLQGDELKSVREGAPIAYQKIEEFAQGVFNTEESLKDLASQGVITSDIIVAAIMNSEEEINSAFENTAPTFAQTWEGIKNAATKAFEPVLQKLNTMLNSEGVANAINVICNAFAMLADAVLWVFGVFGSFFNWCVANWDWLKFIIIGVFTALILALIIYTAVQVQQAMIRIGAWIAEHATIISIILIIAVLVAAIVWLANTTTSGCEFMIYALLLVGAAITLIGLITGSTALVIIGIILLILGVFLMFAQQIIGGAFWLGAALYNAAMGIANFFCACWNWISTAGYNVFAGVINAATAMKNALAAICENVGIAFENAWIWAQNTFWGFLANLFKGLQKFEGVINAIANVFGAHGFSISAIVDSLESKQQEYKEFVDVGAAWEEGMNTMEYKDTGAAWEAGMNTFEYKNLDDAYAAGAQVGANIQNAVGEWGSSMKDGISNLTNGLSMDELTGSNGMIDPNDPAYALDDSYDPSGANADITAGLDKLNGTTEDISDSLDVSDDDFEFLRKIAEMEWRNEFTTAEIKVDMTNNNTVHSERDLDGIVSYLSDVLREEMTNVAYGVHY